MLRKKQQSSNGYHRHHQATTTNGKSSMNTTNNNGLMNGDFKKSKLQVKRVVLSSRLLLASLFAIILFAVAYLYSLNNNDDTAAIPSFSFSSSSSSSSFTSSSSSSYQGVPSYVNVHGQYSSYTKVPLSFKKSFYIPPKTPFRRAVSRAFRFRGWRKSDTPEEAHMIWDKGANSSKYSVLAPWQRYSYYPNTQTWDEKDKFSTGFEKYAQATGTDTYMIPETYRLNTKIGRDKFRQRLSEDGGGLDVPWVHKNPSVNNGKGVTMLAPNSKELLGLLEEVQGDDYDDDERGIVQAYICHELTWTRHQKFDLRFYWMVASIDPLIVLYHDGYVRVGNAAYDESNWDSTTQHLTTHTYLSTEDKGTMDELDIVLRNHVDQNPHLFASTTKSSQMMMMMIRQDPLEHVRNQCRQAIAHTVAAFYDKTFGHHNAQKTKYTAENAYGLYGADFILTEDLHVYYVEAQAGPGMEEEFDFRVELHRDLVRGMIDLVEEVQEKLEVDSQKNVLPLNNNNNTTTTTGWDIVYAGTEGVPKEQHWKYEYLEYNQLRKEQQPLQKNSCDTRTTTTTTTTNHHSKSKMNKKKTSSAAKATAVNTNKKKKSLLLREKRK